MITVKITADNGNYWMTGINTDIDGAIRYFMGRQFVREDDTGKETVDTVVSVDLIADEVTQ